MTLPRLRVPPAPAAAPRGALAPPPAARWGGLGFGGGEHAQALAEAHPHAGLIACEVFENGLCSLLSRLVPESAETTAFLPGNLRVWDGDARLLLRALPGACLSRAFLMFPDPWPKARHVKRRFVHPAQVALLARVLEPGGVWRVASDDPTYQAWVGEVMAAQDWFEAAAPAATRPDGWPPTRYEAKALRAGRTPLYWSFVRSPVAVPA